MSTAYDPLFDPAREAPVAYPLAVELAATRRILDETASLNIHEHGDMLKAAVALNARVRALLAALTAERGEQA